MTETAHFRECYRAFRPSPQVRTLIWAMENISNQDARPYDHAAFPHLGAPGGPMDAFDDPRIRTISLQWATRLGKTFFGQVALTKTADTDPRPMMFASSVESMAKENIARLYASVRQNNRLADLLVKNEREQRQDLVEFRGCKIYVAWSRSVSTLGDRDIATGHCGEFDKWEHLGSASGTAKEGHPHKLYENRFKNHQSVRKCLYEGTPTIKGRSPIERKRLAGSNCSYQVPCPHCKKYQELELGGGETEHGIKWDADEAGRNDPEVAYQTARYVCRHCQAECHDHHRGWMMRRGVWVPEGCSVKHKTALKYAEKLIADPEAHEWKGWSKAKWISGTPAKDGQDYSSGLSSLYALSLGWGDIAKEFLSVKNNPSQLHDFVNGWLGKTWELAAKKTTWEELGRRIIVPTKKAIVPAGFSIVTVAIDVQQDYYVWEAAAWGPDRTKHTLEYGITEDREQLKELFSRKWTLEAGGQIRTARGLIDCGYRPGDVHAFCDECKRAGIKLEPCRGSDRPLDAFYLPRINSKKSSNPGRRVIWVDSAMTQELLDHQLHTVRPGDPGAITLYEASLSEHQDYLEQLLNDAIVPSVDKKNQVVESWQRIDPGIPNDYRDVSRYNFVAMLRETRGQKIKPKPFGQAAAEDDQKTARPRRKLEGDRRGFVSTGDRPSVAPTFRQ